jgi:hypothetical protein
MYFYFLLLSPLGEGFSLPKDDLCQVWLIDPVIMKKSSKSVKVYRRTNGRRTTGAQKISFKISAQVSFQQEGVRGEDIKINEHWISCPSLETI